MRPFLGVGFRGGLSYWESIKNGPYKNERDRIMCNCLYWDGLGSHGADGDSASNDKHHSGGFGSTVLRYNG